MPRPDSSFVIEVSEIVPSYNKLMRMHWTRRRKLEKKWQWLLWLEVYRQKPPPGINVSLPYPNRVEVRITRYSYHLVDDDNLHGSAKIILDGLRKVGVLVDDSPAHIALICEQKQGAPRTVVGITPINEVTESGGSPSEPACPEGCSHCEKTRYCYLPAGHAGQCEVLACAETDDP